MIDLLSIAQTEADGGDLLGLLSSLFESSDVKPTGYSEAVVWQGGKHDDTTHGGILLGYAGLLWC